MGKAKIFVASYSLFLIGLFCVSCYLITTVHPNHVSNTSGDSDTPKADVPSGGGGTAPGGGGGTSPEGGTTPESGRAGSGYPMDSASQDRIDSFESAVINQLFDKIDMPALNIRDRPMKFPDDYLKGENASVHLNQLIDLETSDKDYKKSFDFTSEDNDSFIFKILNKDGNPTIEIKINKRFTKKPKKRKSRKVYSLLQNREKLTSQPEIRLPQTFLIMPNNTVFMERRIEVNSASNAGNNVETNNNHLSEIQSTIVNSITNITNSTFTRDSNITK